MITNLLTSLALPMTGWCASPNGCRPASTSVETTAPVTDIGTIGGSSRQVGEAGQEFAQKTVDGAVETAMSTVVWELAKIGILIVLAIVAFFVIKKLMKLGVEKAKDFTNNLQESEILKARQEQAIQAARSFNGRATIGDAFLDNDEVKSELHDALETSRSFYEEEMAKQDSIQMTFEDSLDTKISQQRISFDADDLDLNSLNQTVSEGMEMVRTKPLAELYQDYSNDLSMEDLLPTGLNSINAIVEDFEALPDMSIQELARNALANAQKMPRRNQG